tara:strand:+ start:113 stop:1129 length:1017 start_codon:yes stop_codon:yes gene_type:complete
MQSLNISVVGLGQGGGRIAKSFYDSGSMGLFINTAKVDLDSLVVDESDKLVIGDGGGAGKDMNKSRKDFESSVEEISERLRPLLDADKVFVCASSGGGTGGGICVDVINLLHELNVDGSCIIGCLMTLPSLSELHSTKVGDNARECLGLLCDMVDDGLLRPLIVVDNDAAKNRANIKSLRTVHDDVNSYIFECLNRFNVRAEQQTPLACIDRNDLADVYNRAGTLFVGAERIVNTYDENDIQRRVEKAFQHSAFLHGDGEIKASNSVIVVDIPTRMMDGSAKKTEGFLRCINKFIGTELNTVVHQGEYECEDIDVPYLYVMSVLDGSPRKMIAARLPT